MLSVLISKSHGSLCVIIQDRCRVIIIIIIIIISSSSSSSSIFNDDNDNNYNNCRYLPRMN